MTKNTMNNDKSGELLLVTFMPKSLSASKLHTISHYKLSSRKVTSEFPIVLFVKILQNSRSIVRASKSNQRDFRILRILKKSENIQWTTISQVKSFWSPPCQKFCLLQNYIVFSTINLAVEKWLQNSQWWFL